MSIWVREKKFYTTFLWLTLIIGLQNLISLGVNLSDNVMLGGYSQTALSGAALANQIQFLLHMMVMGACEGLVILGARFWGGKKLEGLRKAAGVGMVLALGLSITLGAVVFVFPHEVLSLFTDDAAVIAEGAQYLVIICWSYVFFAVTNTILALLRSVETVRIGFLVSLSTLCINVLLNYALIYGNLGFPELGISGSAYATLTARVVECGIVIWYLVKYDRKTGMKLSGFFTIDKPMFRQYLAIGYPILLSNSIWGLAMAAQTAVLGHMGEAAIAANSIANTIFQLVTVIIYASASATAVCIGKTIGEGGPGKVKAYAKTLQMLYLLLGLLTGLLLFMIKDFVIEWYSISGEARSLALQFMTILSITVIGTAYQMPALTGIVRSGGDTKFVLYNDFIFMWLVVLPASALGAFVFELSPAAVFICLKSDQILKCFVAVVKVNRFRWIRAFES
ncbi:MATE family efflux transporter [Paenibacillus lemnae]|uniref:MATE family efflux transporter n=1 Tax=Paenibacillus lemnae TaxID=1330551 RepID=A0A848M658_PAELE|nr:MATE family efflux transporter [Paenibacillus lemnae]NMO95084.1 MATE family efflux transporter [Paenibacillus lemnae]